MMDTSQASEITKGDAYERITPGYQDHVLKQEADAFKRDLISLYPHWKPDEKPTDAEQALINTIYLNAVGRFEYVLRKGVVDGATGFAFLDSDEMSATERTEEVKNPEV